jgi:hypothetical protein
LYCRYFPPTTVGHFYALWSPKCYFSMNPQFFSIAIHSLLFNQIIVFTHITSRALIPCHYHIILYFSLSWILWRYGPFLFVCHEQCCKLKIYSLNECYPILLMHIGSSWLKVYGHLCGERFQRLEALPLIPLCIKIHAAFCLSVPIWRLNNLSFFGVQRVKTHDDDFRLNCFDSIYLSLPCAVFTSSSLCV